MSAHGGASRRRWHARLQAWLLDKFTPHYNRLAGERKRGLFAGLRGRALEIGAGTGANIEYFQNGLEWVATDLNPFALHRARRAALLRGCAGKYCVATASQLPFPAASFDAVVSTLALCSVADPAATLAEIHRVLKPGGRFVFVEHVAAPAGTARRRQQDWICPLWKRLADGCHPNRETWRWIEQAGFQKVEMEWFELPLWVASPHIAGLAWK